MRIRVWVGTSRIAGKGLFVAQDIKKGTRIIQYIGQRISKEETAERLYQGNQYIFAFNDRYNIDGKTLKNTARPSTIPVTPTVTALRVWSDGARAYLAHRHSRRRGRGGQKQPRPSLRRVVAPGTPQRRCSLRPTPFTRIGVSCARSHHAAASPRAPVSPPNRVSPISLSCRDRCGFPHAVSLADGSRVVALAVWAKVVVTGSSSKLDASRLVPTQVEHFVFLITQLSQRADALGQRWKSSFTYTSHNSKNHA